MDEIAALRLALAELTARVDELDAAAASSSSATSAVIPVSAAAASDTDGGTFWILDGLKKRFPESGAVAYAGSVTVAAGPVDWQIGLTTDQVLEMDWSTFAPALAALGHQVRLDLLHAILSGAGSVAELGAGDGMGSTGQLYHHLNQLVSQGWLVAAGRGQYSIPPERIVPLMIILTAARRF